MLEKQLEYNERVHQLFIDFREAYNSVGREELYNILIQFEVTTKLFWPFIICFNERHSKVHIGTYISDNSCVQNGLKQDALKNAVFWDVTLCGSCKNQQHM
jgi:hypothetical protein